MELERSESISRLDANEWDRIAGDDILGTYGWLRVVEENAPGAMRSRYLMVRSGGKLMGAAVLQSSDDRSESTTLDRLLYGRVAPAARRIGLRAAPALIVGSRFGMSEPFLIDQALSQVEREQVVEALVSGILAESERAGAMVIVRNATDATPVRALMSASFQSSPELPTAYLDIKWQTFGAYRSDLKKVHFATEKAIRQEDNRARRSGLRVERITDASEITSDMFALLDSHFRRLNGVPLPFGASFLEQALIHLGDRARVVVARNSTQLLGVNFGLHHSGCARSMMVGIDQTKGRETATYFVLLNSLVQRAIEAADNRVYYGRLLYDLKLRRGCSIVHSSMWLRGRSSVHRTLLRSFIGLRNRRLENIISPYRKLSDENAAAMGRSRQ